MRLRDRIARGVLGAGLLLASCALLARFVLHGPVNGRSLQRAVVLESGSADDSLGDTGARCRPLRLRGEWACLVGDSEGSGSVAYRIVVRPDSSCWDGRATRDDSEGPMPQTIRGCVHLWQWTLFDLVL